MLNVMCVLVILHMLLKEDWYFEGALITFLRGAKHAAAEELRAV